LKLLLLELMLKETKLLKIAKLLLKSECLKGKRRLLTSYLKGFEESRAVITAIVWKKARMWLLGLSLSRILPLS
jgi:hypothetical protein